MKNDRRSSCATICLCSQLCATLSAFVMNDWRSSFAIMCTVLFVLSVCRYLSLAMKVCMLVSFSSCGQAVFVSIWTADPWSTLKNEAQHLGQTEQDQTEQDTVRTEYNLRRRAPEREYSGMGLQEQKCKLKTEQERHNVAMSENGIEVTIRQNKTTRPRPRPKRKNCDMPLQDVAVTLRDHS